MKTVQQIVWDLLLMVILLSSVNAQTVLTLEQCLALAHQQNLNLQSSQNAILSTKLLHEELQTSKLPQIHLAASSIYAPSSGHFGYDPALSNGGQLAGQVVMQQSLYDGGIRNIRLDQINIEIDKLKKEYQLSERDLIYSVKQIFIETLRSEQEIRLLEESLQQLSDYLQTVRQISKGGNANYTDVLKTELQLSNAQIAYQKAIDDYLLAKYSLAEILGGVIDTSFTVQGTLNASLFDTTLVSTINSEMNLEMTIASLEIKKSEAEVALTRHEQSLIVSLVGDVGLLTSGDNLRLPYGTRSAIFGFSFGVVLEIPLFTWGASDLRIQQKELATSDLRVQSKLLQRSLYSEIKKDQLLIIRLRERLQNIRTNRTSAEENFLLTKSKFISGGALSLEVISAQQLLTDSKLAELQILADIQLLQNRLEQMLTQ